MKISKQKLIQALEKEWEYSEDEWQSGFNKGIEKAISLVNSMKGEE